MSEDRTFEPTPQRLAKARSEGNVARSASFVTVVSLAASCVLLAYYGRYLTDSLGAFMREQLSNASNIVMTDSQAGSLMVAVAKYAARLVLPMFVCGIAAAVIANLSQGGFVWAPQRVSPDLSRLSPGRRVASTFSFERVMDVGLELLKMTVCLSVAAISLWSRRAELTVGSEELYASFAQASMCLFEVLMHTLAALATISLFEWWLTKHRHHNSMKMTAEEWQADMKDREPAVAIRKMRKFATDSE